MSLRPTDHGQGATSCEPRNRNGSPPHPHRRPYGPDRGRGLRLPTDPTFDPPGQRYRFGWGTGSRKLSGPAIAAAELGPIDAVLLSNEQHDDNLDAASRALLPAAGTVITVPAAKHLGGCPARAA